MLQSRHVYTFVVTTYLSLLVILVENYFIIWGVSAFLAATSMARLSKNFTVFSNFFIGLILVIIQIYIYRILVQGVFLDGDLTLFGNLGDEARYLSYIKDKSNSEPVDTYEISNYGRYLIFLKLLYEAGGLSIIWLLSGFMYWLAISILCLNLCKFYKDKKYVQVYWYLVFLPDVSIWAASLYKEIWVGTFFILTFTFLRPYFLQIFGLLGLLNFRLVYFLPIFISNIFVRFRKFSIFITGSFLIFLAFCTFYLLRSDLLQYWSIFFGENRILLLTQKLGLQSSWQLLILSPVLLIVSPLIMMATPPHFYVDRVNVFDNLWWITSSTGSYLLYLLPWVCSYKHRDSLMIFAFILSATIVISFLFLTNRHRFVLTMLFTLMGAITLYQCDRPTFRGWTLASVVICLEFLILLNRGQF